MKRTLIGVIVLCFILFVSCQNGQKNDVQTEDPEVSAGTTFDNWGESDLWRVELHDAEKTDSLTATLAAIQYTGDLIETESLLKPKSGYVFLLLHLTIEKSGTGKTAFSWNDAHIEDSSGSVFYRMENDTFLSNLNIPRIKGTDIVLGIETGYICFEISEGSSGLRFVSDDGNIVIDIGM